MADFRFEKLCGDLLQAESDLDWETTHNHAGPDGGKDAYVRKDGSYVAVAAFTTANNQNKKLKNEIKNKKERDEFSIDNISQFVFCCNEEYPGTREEDCVPDHWDLKLWDSDRLISLLRNHDDMQEDYDLTLDMKPTNQSDPVVKTAADVYRENRDEIGDNLRIYEDGIKIEGGDLSIYDRMLLYAVGAAVKENAEGDLGRESRTVSGEEIRQHSEFQVKYPEIYLFVRNRGQFLQMDEKLSKEDIDAIDAFEFSLATKDMPEALQSISADSAWTHRSFSVGMAPACLNEMYDAIDDRSKDAAVVNLVDSLRDIEDYPIIDGRTDAWFSYMRAVEAGATAISNGSWAQLEHVTERMEQSLKRMK
jgi:hypothetical protein